MGIVGSCCPECKLDVEIEKEKELHLLKYFLSDWLTAICTAAMF